MCAKDALTVNYRNLILENKALWQFPMEHGFFTIKTKKC